ncbi:2-dehydro-3-deoxy-6-phosphogalactonate aldolase [Acidisoma cellulosilytica]|uniref:2-dehydro-3-deoxy-6-phosphogalactonate aldolase n=1 Tax=Acidisoma cellulosilyticum TaxID=2802395 RepID=A0A963YZR0_9PROT|nr:2-dehydro-3-deoxy-6-phosphogalactonate aldolase [Acidisoma cellulosilyticum]MCB8880045.1 2-dehydro-3-deoxy-6-phosphogalactonate aldolase [Acidisoma cellulosilyticum]
MKQWFEKCPLIAILRGVRPDEVIPIVAALEAAGVAIVEVPLNSPQPLESIKLVAENFGDRMLVGAGTVMTPDQVREIAAVGGKLIVTPHADPEIVRTAKSLGMLAAPGFFTPAEAFTLLRAGADCIKLFPAEASNPAALRGIRAILPPGTMVVPVGGMTAETIPEWTAAGAAGFGIASAIYKVGDTAEIVGQKAAALVASLRKSA